MVKIKDKVILCFFSLVAYLFILDGPDAEYPQNPLNVT